MEADDSETAASTSAKEAYAPAPRKGRRSRKIRARRFPGGFPEMNRLREMHHQVARDKLATAIKQVHEASAALVVEEVESLSRERLVEQCATLKIRFSHDSDISIVNTIGMRLNTLSRAVRDADAARREIVINGMLDNYLHLNETMTLKEGNELLEKIKSELSRFAIMHPGTYDPGILYAMSRTPKGVRFVIEDKATKKREAIDLLDEKTWLEVVPEIEQRRKT